MQREDTHSSLPPVLREVIAVLPGRLRARSFGGLTAGEYGTSVPLPRPARPPRVLVKKSHQQGRGGG